MKKYKLFLFAFVFCFVLIGFNSNFASAFEPGCDSTSGFSATTGEPCGDLKPAPCPPGTVPVGMTQSIPGRYICSAPTPPQACTITRTLRVGSTGSEVICLQSHLGISADGKFGPKTKAAVMYFQSSKGLVADGIFGPISNKALFN